MPSPSNTNGHSEGTPNGHDPPSGKKGKQKKAIDPNDTSKLLAAKISQLEQDAAGEKDQAAEIDREVKKANRELTNQMAKMGSSNDKIDFLLKKSSELLADMRRVERENQKNKKRGDSLQKEKDANRQELSKANTLKDKLEKLCRELQRDNNKLKGDNKQLLDDAKYTSAGVDERVMGLLAKLDGYQDEKDGQGSAAVGDVQLDEAYRSRFRSFIEQYELREIHYQSQMRAKELEVHYHLSRYERERNRFAAEASQNRSLRDELKESQQNEADLKAQLNLYIDKFKQVEDTLNNSNELFLTFRREMEDMSRKTKRLEKEKEMYRRKHDTTNANIISMVQERQNLRGDRDGLREKWEAEKRRADKLMDIIRGMQDQGRKVSSAAAAAMEKFEPENGESECSGEADEDEQEDSDEYDDDESDESEESDRPIPIRPPLQPQPQPQPDLLPTPRPFGPERPPQPQPATNGH